MLYCRQPLHSPPTHLNTMKKLLSSAVLGVLAVSAFAKFDSPEQAIAALAAAEAANKAPPLADLLPESYQKDLTGIVNLFATKMDGEVWTSVTDLLTTAAKTLSAKAEFLVGDDVAAADRPAQAKSIASGLASLSSVLASDTVKLENLKTTSSMKLIETLVDAALPFAATSGTSVSNPENFKVVNSQTLDNGDVRITFANDYFVKSIIGDTSGEKSMDFRSIEGCWIPTGMADEWTEIMASARTAISENIDFTSTKGQQLKQQLLMMAPSLKMGLAQLANAQSKDQLQQSAGMMLMPLLMMGGNMGGGAGSIGF